MKVYDKPNYLVLRYECFWNDNFDYIFDEMQAFFQITILPEMREKIRSECNVDVMRKVSTQFVDFSRWDTETKIHGDHISTVNGAPGAWKTTIPERFHAQINARLAPYLRKFGYDV
jgi:hypothetical protein